MYNPPETFAVPLCPYVPLLGLTCNAFLLAQCSFMAWIRAGDVPPFISKLAVLTVQHVALAEVAHTFLLFSRGSAPRPPFGRPSASTWALRALGGPLGPMGDPLGPWGSNLDPLWVPTQMGPNVIF